MTPAILTGDVGFGASVTPTFWPGIFAHDVFAEPGESSPPRPPGVYQPLMTGDVALGVSYPALFRPALFVRDVLLASSGRVPAASVGVQTVSAD